MWKTGRFCRHLPRQNVVFSTYRQQSIKSRSSYPPLFPGQFRGPVDKSSAVFSQPCRRKKNFLPFAQRSELFLSGGTDGFWLVNRQPFQKPAVFLAAKIPYFRRIPRPLEPAVIQTFIIEAEPIFFEMQRFNPVAASPAEKEQGVAVRI